MEEGNTRKRQGPLLLPSEQNWPSSFCRASTKRADLKGDGAKRQKLASCSKNLDAKTLRDCEVYLESSWKEIMDLKAALTKFPDVVLDKLMEMIPFENLKAQVLRALPVVLIPMTLRVSHPPFVALCC